MHSVAGSPSPSADSPLERIGRIADVIAGSGAANEALGRLTPEVLDKLHEQRLFRLLLPKAYGGDEVDLVAWFRAMEALAKLDGSTAWCVGQINGCAATASALDPTVSRKIWGNPRAALSWGPPIRSRAEETDGGHRLTGEWMMSSGSRHATWIGLMAPVFDRSGVALELPEGTTRIFLVPAGAVEWIENWDVLGLRATNSGGFKVNSLLVPNGFSVNREHLRDVRLPGPLYKFPLNGYFSIGFSAVALGIARAMLDACVALTMQKTPRLAKTALRDSHLVQFQIGEAEARLRSARTYVEATARQVYDAVASCGKLELSQRIDTRMATTFAIHEAKAVADTAWEIAGANAIFASAAFERRLRDISTLLQQAQGRQSHLQDAGAFLLGHEANLAFA
ncbi:MAG TPA: acyl-CoA dehydrogenase family protein [Hyphomicrobiaceae bacterium]|nr:acyl-CoA dehydrogenase family protein [Hyphomicrobiaceae bacterium]